MNTKLIKSFAATFAIGTLSLGASAGFALPASAQTADIVAPAEVVTGICGQSGTAVATLRPGEILKGRVNFATGQGTVTVADTTGAYSQTFNGNDTTDKQSFVIMNTSNNIDAVYSCKTDPSVGAVLEADDSQQQQQQQQQQSVSTPGPIHIDVENNIKNDNSNHNDINNKNVLSNHNHNNHNHHHNNHNHNHHHNNHNHHHNH